MSGLFRADKAFAATATEAEATFVARIIDMPTLKRALKSRLYTLCKTDSRNPLVRIDLIEAHDSAAMRSLLDVLHS